MNKSELLFVNLNVKCYTKARDSWCVGIPTPKRVGVKNYDSFRSVIIDDRLCNFNSASPIILSFTVE